MTREPTITIVVGDEPGDAAELIRACATLLIEMAYNTRAPSPAADSDTPAREQV